MSDYFQRCIKLIFFQHYVAVMYTFACICSQSRRSWFAYFHRFDFCFSAFFYVAVSKLIQTTGNLGDLCTDDINPE